MGLTSWEGSPDGKILRTDVSVAKNYLKKDELESLGRMVSSFLDLAEDFAKRKIPMTMEDWAGKLDSYLQLSGRDVLRNAGSVSHKNAVLYAESEFEKYRIVQDKLFESDFDKFVEEGEKN